jgi:hypothetical protein
MAGGIEVDGLKELNAAIRRATDSELPKRMGQANKLIGELVISKLEPRPDPLAVGEGAGATVRASASKREVLLRVGGAHRPKPPLSVWGKRRGGVGRAPKRPFITETARRHEDEIAAAYLEAIAEALDPAFYKTES